MTPPRSPSAQPPPEAITDDRAAAARDDFAVAVLLSGADSGDDARARTLDSLRAQTLAAWEMAGDGATDSTSAPPWVLMLDAGDTIHPTVLARARDVLTADPSLDAVHCGWTLVDECGGALAEERCEAEGDLFDLLARRSAFPSCACIVRRSLADGAGLRDAAPSGTTAWRLWQRMARRGARFARLHETLVSHAVRAVTSADDVAAMLDAALATIALGHMPDPDADVAPAAPYAAGRLSSPDQAVLEAVCVAAGGLLALGHDADAALARLPAGLVAMDLSDVADLIARSAPLALARPLDDWRDLWAPVRPRVERFFAGLESRLRARGTARRMTADLQRLVLPYLAPALPSPVAGTCIVPIEVTQPIGDLATDADVEHAHLVVSAEGAVLGVVELAVCDGRADAAAIRDAIARALAWPILGRYLARSAGADLSRHDVEGWRVLHAELWAIDPPWRATLSDFIDRVTARIRGRDDGRAHGMPRPMVVEAGAAVPWLVRGARNVAGELRVAGVRVATREIAIGRAGMVTGAAIRAALADAAGLELCRVIVRDVLLGAPFTGPPLRDRIERVRRGAGA